MMQRLRDLLPKVSFYNFVSNLARFCQSTNGRSLNHFSLLLTMLPDNVKCYWQRCKIYPSVTDNVVATNTLVFTLIARLLWPEKRPKSARVQKYIVARLCTQVKNNKNALVSAMSAVFCFCLRAQRLTRAQNPSQVRYTLSVYRWS